MRQSTRFGAAALLVIGAMLTSCRSPRAEAAVAKGTYYTQYSMYFEREATRSTNYRRGALLPINTAVELLSIAGDRAVVQIPSGGRTLTFEHLPRHTHDTLEQAFRKAFGPAPVDLSGFSAAEQESIANGKATVGMSKLAVLAAVGPPPASGTMSLEAREWRYWDTRVSSFNIRFDSEDRVVDAGR